MESNAYVMQTCVNLTFLNFSSQFFESTTDSNPRKKTKVEDIADVDEHEESMPGYHEFDETDCNAHAHDDELEMDVEVPELELLHATRTRPPHSTSRVEPSSNNKQAAGLSRPRSSSEASNSKSKQHRGEVPVITQTCPICAKVLETDNAGLNAHIDFCLSRGTIMQAQKEASKISSQSHSNRGAITEKSVSKPRSYSKRKGG
jgi:DNA polymerase kappa